MVLLICLSVGCLYGSELQRDLDAILDKAEKKVHFGVEVVSLETGDIVYQRNNLQTFVPASSLKLFIGASALSILGVDYRFETKIFVDSSGNLFLKGSGDPSFNQNDLRDMVAQLKRLDIDEIGDVTIDNTIFDRISQGPGWMWDEPYKFWTAPVDGMVVNHNVIDIWVIPSSELNSPPRVKLEPIMNDETVINEAVCTEENDFKVTRPTFPQAPAIVVQGRVPVHSAPRLFQIPVLSPTYFAGRILVALLEEANIKVKGKIVAGQTPSGCEEVASHASAPLSEIVELMMKESDNLYGDMLFKKMGEVCFQEPGTWQKGALAVGDFLRRETNIDPAEIVIVDGSGLSRYNLISPHQYTQLLMWGANEFGIASEFIGSLPISGVDRFLKKRMVGAKSMIRAKTGSMTGISAIAGYATTKSGKAFVFAIMSNGYTCSSKEVRAIEDEICVRLALIPFIKNKV